MDSLFGWDLVCHRHFITPTKDPAPYLSEALNDTLLFWLVLVVPHMSHEVSHVLTFSFSILSHVIIK